MSVGWGHADFAALVGESVTLRSVDGPAPGSDVQATIAECTDAAPIGDLVNYRVRFVAEPGAQRRQAVFLVEASGRDPEPIFLVPVGETGDRLEYEAVFNQSVRSGT